METPAKIKEGIFISYRREGGSTFAGILYYELCRHFSSSVIFKDVNTLKPGSNFKSEIESAIETSSVLLVLIDNNWINLKNEKGEKKILARNDFVRHEIKIAIDADIEIIPVLFENGSMPGQRELPKDIIKLCDKNAFTVHAEFVMKDIAALIEHIKSKRRFLFEEKTITGSYERLFKDPLGTMKKAWTQSVDIYKKDFTYLKGFLNRKRNK